MNKTLFYTLSSALLISLVVIIYLIYQLVIIVPSHEGEYNPQPFSSVSIDSTSGSITQNVKHTVVHDLSDSTSINLSPPSPNDLFDERDLLGLTLSQLPVFLAQLEQYPNFIQIHAIETLLQEYPYHFELLIREGKMRTFLGELQLAIDSFTQALSYSKSDEEAKRAQQLVLMSIDTLIGDYRSEQRSDEAIASYEQYEPYLVTSTKWRSALDDYASSLLDKKEYEQLQQSLDSWRLTPLYAAPNNQIDLLQNKLNAIIMGTQAIPITAVGSQYLVNTTINNHNFVLLIDTGASYSVLTTDALAQANNVLSGRPEDVRFNTAGGTVVGQIYYNQKLSLGNLGASNAAVAVIDYKSRFDGLLGMDYLSQFNFRIDQAGSLLFISLPD